MEKTKRSVGSASGKEKGWERGRVNEETVKKINTFKKSVKQAREGEVKGEEWKIRRVERGK